MVALLSLAAAFRATLLPSMSTILATNVLFTATSAVVLAYLTAAASLATVSSTVSVRLYFVDTARTVILEPTYFSLSFTVISPVTELKSAIA
ncbi:MAG: hypothetical protein IKU46_04850 [Peptococcaceae bacterium]|nr:hypothetical protein [Peptococcaceae bacterium]